MALYHNEGNALFVDEAPRSDVGRKSLLTLGFACFFFDYDLDGWPDIFVANGHVYPQVDALDGDDTGCLLPRKRRPHAGSLKNPAAPTVSRAS